MTGYTPEEMTETSFINFIHPDDRDAVMNECLRRTGGTKDKARYKARIITKNNEIRTFAVTSVLFKWGGKPATLVFLTDITEQEMTANDLKTSEAYMRAFFESSFDSICLRDRKGALIFCNESFNRVCASIFGVEASVGLKTGQLVPDEQRKGTEKAKESFYKVFEDGQTATTEFQYRWPNGETRYIDITWTPVKSGDTVYAVAEVTRDITEKRNIELTLKKHLELLEGFLRSSTEAIFGFEIDPPMSMDLTIDDQVDYVYEHARVSIANEA